ncbi:hypothetical protein QJQ45_015990 [Haematococcus lacustris]|nr:hypothetical protein QJQ45_015990 [Haematococcus lacustris]
MGMGLDPEASRQSAQHQGCKLTRSQVQHDSGLIQARRNTQRCNDNVKLERQHLAAATQAGTSLVAIQRHVAVTLATWDAVCGEYLHPKWAEQKMRLYLAQEKVLERSSKKLEEEAAMVSQQRWGTRKQLVVFFGNAGIGTWGGWGAKAVVQSCRKVLERPNSGKPTDRVNSKAVTVDEFRTSSAMNSPQPCEEELDRSKPNRPEDWKPKPVAPRKPRTAATQPAASEPGLSTPPQAKRTKAEQAAEPTQPTKGKGQAQGKAATVKPAPQPGRWVDRDCNQESPAWGVSFLSFSVSWGHLNCNAALNMQRIGESRWRQLQLYYWQEQGKLPAKGKEYPGPWYKRVRDKPPKAQQQQPACLSNQMLAMLACNDV